MFKKGIAVTISILLILANTACGMSTTDTKGTGIKPGSEDDYDVDNIKVMSYQNLDKEPSGLLGGGNQTFIGLGYNILENSYIHFEGFTSGRSILDQAEVAKRILNKAAPAQKSYTITGQTMKSYCDSFAVEMELKSSYPLFTGKITSDFDKSLATKTNTYFIKSLSTYPKYSEYINITNDLNTILDDTFEAALNGGMTPEELFTNYGTHLVVEDLMGARCEYNYTYTSTETQTTAQIKLKVDAAYKFISGSASDDEKKTAAEFLQNSAFSSSLSGGTYIDATTLTNLVKNMPIWIASIETTTPTIYGISNMNSLVPIWDLTTDPVRKQEIKDAFDSKGGDIQKFIDSMSTFPEPTPAPVPATTYIRSIVVLSDSDYNQALNQLPSGYHLVGKDLNKDAGGDFIYFAYNTTTNPDEALTDLRVSYGDYKMPSGYKKNEHDLNSNAGGKYIYLWTTTKSSNGKPIKTIKVFYGKNADMPTGYTEVDYNRTGDAAELNCDAGGDWIYLGFTR